MPLMVDRYWGVSHPLWWNKATFFLPYLPNDEINTRYLDSHYKVWVNEDNFAPVLRLRGWSFIYEFGKKGFEKPELTYRLYRHRVSWFAPQSLILLTKDAPHPWYALLEHSRPSWWKRRCKSDMRDATVNWSSPETKQCVEGNGGYKARFRGAQRSLLDSSTNVSTYPADEIYAWSLWPKKKGVKRWQYWTDTRVHRGNCARGNGK